MNVNKETITPKKATEYLKRNVNNRPLLMRHVDTLSNAMKGGEWCLNGDAIRFSGEDGLIDGQHRLTACVKSGVPFETYVIRGLKQEAFDTIDRGRNRHLSDVLARRGEKNYRQLATAVKFLHRYENGFLAAQRSLRPPEMDAILEKNPGLRDSVTLSRGHLKNELMPDSHVAFLHYITNRIDSELAGKFWAAVVSGEGLRKTMPEYSFRERLIANKGSVAKVPADTLIAMGIKAWNAKRQNKECRSLRWSRDEQFPEAI